MSEELMKLAEKFVDLFERLEAGFWRLPERSRLSVVDNGYIANKLEARYPRMRYSAYLRLGDGEPAADVAGSGELPPEVEALGAQIMEILGDLWVCDFEMRKEAGELEVQFSLPILGGTEVASDPLSPRKAKQFLKLRILYGDISDFGVGLACGSMKKLGPWGPLPI